MRKETRLISPPSSVLFDKGVIRRVYERHVRLAAGRPPPLLQVEAASTYARVASFTSNLWITEQTANILHRRTPVFAASIRSTVGHSKRGATCAVGPDGYATSTSRRRMRLSLPTPASACLPMG